MVGFVSVCSTCVRVTQIRVVDVNLVRRLRLALFWWPITDVPAIYVSLFVCVCQLYLSDSTRDRDHKNIRIEETARGQLMTHMRQLLVPHP